MDKSPKEGDGYGRGRRRGREEEGLIEEGREREGERE
jgi:hypothetical protein